MPDNQARVLQSMAAASTTASNAPADDADMFELAPVSLWLEDFSAVREVFEGWRAQGVVDLRAFCLRTWRGLPNVRRASG